MSSLYGMSAEAEDQLLNQPHGELDLNRFKPSWYGGLVTAPFTGVGALVSDVTLPVADAYASTVVRPFYETVDAVLGTDYAGPVTQNTRRMALEFSKFTSPDPTTAGPLAQVIHSLVNVVPEVMLGGPEVAASLQGYKAMRMGADQGLSEPVALGLGAIVGGTTFAGMKIPNVLAPKLSASVNAALAASANAGFGIVQRGATGEYLKAAGYPEMADQYKAMDTTSIVTDLILGAAFGGYESYQNNKVQAQRQALIDAAMTAMHDRHRNMETAPGIPLDPATRQAHADYMVRLMEAELNGEEPPPIPPELVGDGFLADPELTAARDEIGVAVRRHLGELGEIEAELAARGLPTDPELYSVTPNNRSVLDRDPIMQDAAQRLKAGEITGAEYRRIADERKPVLPYQNVPEPATEADLQRGLKSGQHERIMEPQNLEEGRLVGIRLDIPAYSNNNVWVVSVHEPKPDFSAGKSIGYSSTAAATNVTLGVDQPKVMNIAAGGAKGTFAVMKGNWKPMTPAQAKALAKRAMKDPAWTQIGMDPTRRAFFYDRKTMQPIVAADEVVQIGPLVLGKNVTYGKADDHLFSIVGEPAARIAARVSERPPVRFTDRVRGLLDRWKEDGDTRKLLDELVRLDADLETRAVSNEAKRGAEPVRGELWVRERFMRAERNGEISPAAHNLVKWLLNKNPALATDLALSFKGKGGDAGSYNPAKRLATIFTTRANELTAVHEVLHHIERMLPEKVRSAIRQAWLKDLQSQYDLAKEVNDTLKVNAIDDALRAAAGDRQAFDRVANQIRKGELPADFYQNMNPSEYWAENASRLVQQRAGRDGWVAELKQWMKEFLQKVQEFFGVSSKAAIIRGLEAAIESDGAIRGRMLSALGDDFKQNAMPFDGKEIARTPLAAGTTRIMVDGVERPALNSDGRPIHWSEEGTRNFWRWFGDSKVVDSEGRPRVMYHGSDAKDFASFNKGSYFSSSAQEAGAYAFPYDFVRREKGLKKYTLVEGPASLIGTKVQYAGVLDDAIEYFSPKNGDVVATDNGVYRKNGKNWEAFTNIDVEYGSGDFSNGQTFITLKAGDGAAAKEHVADYVDSITKRYTGGVGGRVVAAYLKIDNPAEVEPFTANLLGFRIGATEESVKAQIQKQKDKGHDGIVTQSDEATAIFEVAEDLGGIPDQYIIFDGKQAKSAVGNRGSFDAANPDMLLQPAWHGSKQRFQRFSLDFIGTGTGAQMYGWGLYFSGSRETGQAYYDRFTELWKNTAQLYGVDIPDPAVARMLLWDRPMSEQPENVKMAYEALKQDLTIDKDLRELLSNKPDMLGLTLYRTLQQNDAFKGDGRRQASLLLAEYGIPGTKYFGDHDTGNDPYNYVLWDEAVINEMNDTVETHYSVVPDKENGSDVRPEQTGDRGRRYSSRGLAPLEGAPAVRGFHGPDPQLVSVAERYAAANGIPLRRQAEYVNVDEEFARRVAKAYDEMEHAPNDPVVREAYENLARQTTAQYRALEEAGYRFWFIDLSKPEQQDYVSTPWNAMRDIRENKQMGVFPTAEGFGTGEDFDPTGNPLLADTGIKWPVGGPDGPLATVLANDLFRAVHDAFGHGLEGAGFRAQGEENAWQAHARLFTGSAVGAITSETRGQNSWLNYGPYGEANRNAKVEDTVFGDQKTGLMPEWTWTENVAGDMTPEPELLSVVPEPPSTTVSRMLRRSAERENRPSVIVGGRPGEFGWTFTQKDVLPSPVQHPVVRGPRLEKIAPMVRAILETSEFQKLAKDLFGIKGLTISQIEGTWKGAAEPSYALHSKTMTSEQANKLGRLLGFAFSQDAVVVTKHSPGLAEGVPTLYIGTGKKLTSEQVNAIMSAARERGLDLSTSADGTAVKFMHFGDEAELADFVAKVTDISKISGTKPPVTVRTQGDLHEAEQYLDGEVRADGSRDGLLGSERDRPAVLGRVLDSLVIPYAKAVGSEGYRLSPELFGKRFGLSEAEVALLTERLKPSEDQPRSTVKLMTGEETLDIQPTGKNGKPNITDVMWALQNRAAKLGFIMPGDYSESSMRIIGKAMVDEVAYHVKHALKSAIGWYDAALKNAKTEYDKILPEINANPVKGMLFDAILGITSQGNDVFANSKFAVRVFELVRDDAYTISEAVKILKSTFGDKTAQIEMNLLKLEHLLNVNGYDRMRTLFNTTMTVSEWNAILRRDPSLFGPDGKALSAEGQASQKITGWMVFGPKIGSFINNLHGDYSTLTADLWFSRTWNRLLGFMFTHAPMLEAKQYQEFKDALQAEFSQSTEAKTQNGKAVMKKGKPVPWENGNDVTHLTPDELQSLLNSPEQLLALANQLEGVYRKGGYKQKTDLRRRAKNWIESREGVQETPRGDLERSFQQKTVEWAQKQLKTMGLDITVADIQAALWFHEKDMFAKFGVADGKAKPADYADAARETVKLYNKGELFWVESDGKYIGGLDGKYLGTRVPDENGRLVPAGKMIEAADAEVKTAEQESPKFEEAVKCELRG